MAAVRCGKWRRFILAHMEKKPVRTDLLCLRMPAKHVGMRLVIEGGMAAGVVYVWPYVLVAVQARPPKGKEKVVIGFVPPA